jgi:hypothetical protein
VKWRTVYTLYGQHLSTEDQKNVTGWSSWVVCYKKLSEEKLENDFKKLLLFSGWYKYFEVKFVQIMLWGKDDLPDFQPTLFRTVNNCNGNTNQFNFQSIANLNGSSSINPARPNGMILRFTAMFDHCATADTWFVPKLSVLIFLCTNWQRSTSLMYIGTFVVTLAACPYLFQLDWLSQSRKNERSLA